ncbi:MAG: hypothetical protein K8S97_14070 [Anaerolineae bacterium]|nr:hypothetical protein [Anaerolineae bacterium]
MRVIVDTNVPIVANGKSEQAAPECALACVQRIAQIQQSGTVVLDNQWWILREYQQDLRSEGQPGVGDAFLKWVLRNRATSRCMLVSITPCEPNNSHCTDFEEYPDDSALEDFDPSDRKFVAVAIAHQDHPPVLNATDSDWWHFREALANHGIDVEFLCDDQVQRWDDSP